MSRLPRCIRCRMLDDLCICPVIRRQRLKTRVIAIIHNVEYNKISNTGRLVNLTLENSATRIYGRKGLTFNSDDFIRDDYQTFVLYPRTDATILTEEFVENLKKPVQLIVPDGSWRQAYKMSLRCKPLQSLPSLTLPELGPSQYRLRTHHDPKRVSTFEAISRALGILEGSNTENGLNEVFLTMIERLLWQRGKLREYR